MTAIRSLLFVPANRPERFIKACSSGADLVCLDLEDATPPSAKGDARAACVEFLRANGTLGAPIGVRINGSHTEWCAADLEATIGLAAFLMVPKAEDVDELKAIYKRAPATPLWPLVETGEGLRRAWEIAAAPGVAGVLFGAFDYSADVGCELDWEPLLFARSLLVAACARARVQSMDAPLGDVTDEPELVASTIRARALGFGARACIHPEQVGPVNAVFTPTAAQVARARSVIAAFDAAGGAAAQLDGKLIELPVALAARRILAAALSAGPAKQLPPRPPPEGPAD